ncbi:jg19936 [Pararge aegeria aegeria]|uniref:Jg19936 protein n=1 Tax=Pararge aegeria aegeria TaxID=348720 RepID=A0A8S4RUX2_9NEOP|nr:jg19936 [Pararge aegeria aegeria]
MIKIAVLFKEYTVLLTPAERVKRYREKIKRDPEKCKIFKRKENNRVKKYSCKRLNRKSKRSEKKTMAGAKAEKKRKE